MEFGVALCDLVLRHTAAGEAHCGAGAASGDGRCGGGSGAASSGGAVGGTASGVPLGAKGPCAGGSSAASSVVGGNAELGLCDIMAMLAADDDLWADVCTSGF